jgi:alpha-mannosidase
MSAFKKADDRDSLIIRIFNPTDTEQSVEITFFKNIKKAYICNLNEERQSDVCVNGKSLKLVAQKCKIVTLEIEF